MHPHTPLWAQEALALLFCFPKSGKQSHMSHRNIHTIAATPISSRHSSCTYRNPRKFILNQLGPSVAGFVN